MLASIYLIPQRIMMWSAGLTVFTKSMSRRETVKKVLTHPCVVACGIGLILMFGGITPPEVLLTPLQTIGRCNTALSMLVIGMILAAMPAGATTSMLAAKYGTVPEFATKMVVFSTLCSIPSIAAWSVLLH